jgi:antirestriction protein ArdC
MQGFRSPGGPQRFIAVFSAVRNLFVPPRSRRSVLATHPTHLHRLNAVAQWKAVAGIAACPLCRYRHNAHASGHPTRLNRDLSGGFGSVLYAKEEVRALS